MDVEHVIMGELELPPNCARGSTVPVTSLKERYPVEVCHPL
jgi:hypothetical protein